MKKIILIGLCICLVLLMGCEVIESGDFKCKTPISGTCWDRFEKYTRAKACAKEEAQEYCLLVTHKIDESHYKIFDYYGNREECPADTNYITDPKVTHPSYKGEIFIDLTKPLCD